MLVQKFEYKSIPRVTNEDGSRLYSTPTGERVPSVTTILSKTQTEEKKMILKNWRDRVGHENAQKITTEAASRGTRMHTYLEKYVEEGALPERGSNPFSWASHAMAQTVIKEGLCKVNEFWGIEVPLYYPGVYAGTTDGVGVHQNDHAIIDYKQSNRAKKEEWIDDYKLQLAAYAIAHNEVHKTKINKGVVLMCVKPEIDPVTFEIITPPQYQEFIIQGEDFKYWEKQWWKRVEQFYEQKAQEEAAIQIL